MQVLFYSQSRAFYLYHKNQGVLIVWIRTVIKHLIN